MIRPNHYDPCPAQGIRTRIPLDESLGVTGTSFSPGVRRFMARAGSRSSFVDASEDLLTYARLEVTPKQVQRVAEDVGRAVEDWNGRQTAATASSKDSPGSVPILYVSFDGTGVPMRKNELHASKGKGPDGKAKTREVKLGCVFTQTKTDEEGWPVRDPDSTTYIGAIESSELFGLRIYQEAVRRGSEQAGKIVVLTDGARYNRACPRRWRSSTGAGLRAKKRGHGQQKMLPCPKLGVYISVCTPQNTHANGKEDTLSAVPESRHCSGF